ncbi:hypothetical protein N0V90_010773 [Kalmusia sp. IMI 367209]|nr:hypothetical protein N0V90_010773 [Kalmusia sp. IMI 367209]
MCGVNATLPLFPVKTLKIAAGSTIGIAASGQSRIGSREDQDFADFNPSFSMYHTGPATAYLSKAPGELNDYNGDGDWFKIAVVPASDGLHWDFNGQAMVSIMNFTIPAATPPGKYLLRAEHLNMENGNSYKTTEMYINCVHVEITGSGTGNPGPVTKFPGAFDAKDPGELPSKRRVVAMLIMMKGIWLPNQLSRPIQPMDELKNWQGAGPKVWKG